MSIPANLECAVCRGLLDMPVSLNCHHIFCCSCLQAMVNEDTISCPVCRVPSSVPSGGVGNFPSARLIAGNVEAYKLSTQESVEQTCQACDEAIATHFCTTCLEYYCDEDVLRHKKLKATRDHDLFSVEDAKSASNAKMIVSGLATQSLSCKEHGNEQLSLFCDECKILICSLCLYEPMHKLHKDSALPVKTAGEKQLMYAQDIIKKLKSYLTRFKKSLEEHYKICVEVKGNLASTLTQINQEFDVIVDLVNARRRLLIEGITESARYKEKTLLLQAEQIEVHIASAERSLLIADTHLQSETVAGLLEIIPTLQAREAELQNSLKLTTLSEDSALFCDFKRKQLELVIDFYGTLVLLDIDVQQCSVSDVGEGKIEILLRNNLGSPVANANDKIILNARKKGNTVVNYTVEEVGSGKYIAHTDIEYGDECSISIYVLGRELCKDLIITRMYFAEFSTPRKLRKSRNSLNELVEQEVSKEHILDGSQCHNQAIGSARWRHGKHTWKIRATLTMLHHKSFIQFGVISNLQWQASNYNRNQQVAQSWTLKHDGFGYWLDFDGNSSTFHSKQKSFVWQPDDVFELTLDCDNHTLSVLNLRTEVGETKSLRASVISNSAENFLDRQRFLGQHFMGMGYGQSQHHLDPNNHSSPRKTRDLECNEPAADDEYIPFFSSYLARISLL